MKEYPLSQRVGDAKAKLVAFNVPVPQADPKALAWMQAEASAQRPKQSLVGKTTALVHTGPRKELSLAARNGAPQLDPEADTTNVADVLAGGGKTALGAGGSSPTGNTAVVEVATPGTGANGSSTVEAGDTAGTPPAATGDASGTAAAPSADNPSTANADTTAAPAAGTGRMPMLLRQPRLLPIRRLNRTIALPTRKRNQRARRKKESGKLFPGKASYIRID